MKTVTTLEQVKAIIAAGPVFVRWSHGPDQDRSDGWQSKNHQTGAFESGMSVNDFPADGSDYDIYTRLAEYRHIGHPVCYLCRGEVVGTGSDGEPCLTDVVPVAIVDDALILGEDQRRLIERRDYLATALQKQSLGYDYRREIDLYKRQVAALEAGEKWAWNVERYNK